MTEKLELRHLINTPGEYADKAVQVSGWVRTLRASKNFGFIEINDGTTFKNLQVVFEENLSNFEDISKTSLGSAITVKGQFVETPGAKQPFELKASEVEINGLASADYPIQKKRHSFEYLRTISHLRPRTNTFLAVFRVRSLISYAIHKFFQEKAFVYVHTPIMTSVDAEGAGEMFRITTLDMENPPRGENKKIDYSEELLGRETYLTVSGQLAVETFCLGFRNVYTFGPTFRAENSNTARHASEFWMVEPEAAFANLNDIMDLAEDMLKYLINFLMENAPDEMAFFNSFVDTELLSRLDNIVKSDFARVSYTEAVDILKNSGHTFEYPVEWGENLQTEHERYLAEEKFKKPVFVTDYPKDIKAFYMKMNEDGKTVRAMDLLVPGVGEIIGGSQREERLDVLSERMAAHHISEEEYSWYLDTRRFGTFEHAGFGLGLERAVMYLTGMKNIRDVIPFPRTPNSMMA